MTAQRIGTFEVESLQWHAARAGGIGGSEIGAVLGGLSKWDSRFSLWHQKTGNLPPRPVKAEMDAGKRLEPVILDWWKEQHPELTGRRCGTYRSKELPWQIANPDLLAYADHHRVGIVEAKYALYDYEWGTPGTDEVPPYYLTQCRWYLDVFDLPVCWLPMFVGSAGQFREYVVRADEVDQQLMRDAGAEFMDSLESGESPDIDEHSATYEAVRRLHPGIDRDLEVDIPVDVWETYDTTHATAAEAAAAHRKAKSVLLDLLGDARIGTVSGQAVVRRQPGRGESISLYPVKRSAVA